MTAIDLNRGSDLDFKVFWPAAEGSTIGADLTGYAIEGFEAHPALAGRLALSIQNPTGAQLADEATWQIAASITWADDMPTGDFLRFAIRLTSAGKRITTPAITVRVA